MQEEDSCLLIDDAWVDRFTVLCSLQGDDGVRVHVLGVEVEIFTFFVTVCDDGAVLSAVLAQLGPTWRSRLP